MLIKRPIGILDSGVGGLTVVKELQQLLPHEDILYIGDNKNVPYGNKSQAEIISLTKKMLDFFVQQDVKVIGIGCNTISTIIENFVPDYKVPILGIVDPVVAHAATLPENKIGLLATHFTVNCGCYNSTLAQIDKTKEIRGEGCLNLASIIDNGDLDEKAITEEIQQYLAGVLSGNDISTVILGCTHYPIAQNIFQKHYPNICFLNPAFYQAQAIKKYLSEKNMLTDKQDPGSINIYTTGDTEKYEKVLKVLPIEHITCIQKISLE